jgi:hypothetical protein
MPGYKNFQTGAVLSEGDLDNFLMQGVLVFADSSARDDALGTTTATVPLFHGRVVYLTSTNTFQIYNGTAYVSIATEAFVNTAIATIRDPLIRLYMDAGLSMM